MSTTGYKKYDVEYIRELREEKFSWWRIAESFETNVRALHRTLMRYGERELARDLYAECGGEKIIRYGGSRSKEAA